MASYLDVSLPITPDMPQWPGSPPIELKRLSDMDQGDKANDSFLACGVHTGTHVDAPLHFLADGVDVTHLPLDALIGPAVLVALPDDVNKVTAEILEGLNLPPKTERLLLRTRNSKLWERGEREFQTDFVALTADAARWVVDRNIRLIGVDYLSVQLFHDSNDTHLILLKAKVSIVEGLNFSKAAPGNYEFICLPLRLASSDGSPARAVLRSST